MWWITWIEIFDKINTVYGEGQIIRVPVAHVSMGQYQQHRDFYGREVERGNDGQLTVFDQQVMNSGCRLHPRVVLILVQYKSCQPSDSRKLSSLPKLHQHRGAPHRPGWQGQGSRTGPALPLCHQPVADAFPCPPACATATPCRGVRCWSEPRHTSDSQPREQQEQQRHGLQSMTLCDGLPVKVVR